MIATSTAERTYLTSIGIRHDRITLVPPGVDCELICPDHSSTRRDTRHRMVLIGPITQAGAAIQALGALPDTQLVIPHDPDSESELVRQRVRPLVQRLGLGERVHLDPLLDTRQRISLLTSADVALYFSRPGQGYSPPLEAMACGVPVVTSARTPHDAVVDGVTGLHVDERDVTCLDRSLRQLLGNPAVRQCMGVAGRDRAISRYSWPRIASETARAYQTMISQATAPRADHRDRPRPGEPKNRSSLEIATPV